MVIFRSAVIVRALIAAVMLFAVACTTPPDSSERSAGEVAFHSFSFDVRPSMPKVVVMDYRYGAGQVPGTRLEEYMLRKGAPVATTNVGGWLKVGEELYVKWKVLATGEIFERTVDLKPLLPRDMDHKRVTFDIKGDQLYVYVVYPDRRPADAAPNGPRLYRNDLVKTIYPSPDRAVQ